MLQQQSVQVGRFGKRQVACQAITCQQVAREKTSANRLEQVVMTCQQVVDMSTTSHVTFKETYVLVPTFCRREKTSANRLEYAIFLMGTVALYRICSTGLSEVDLGFTKLYLFK